MSKSQFTTVTLFTAMTALSACASERVAPKSLVDARADFERAKAGPAAQLDPTDLHEADLALQQAEHAWSDAPDDPATNDMVLLADRKALIAEANAGTLKGDSDQARDHAQLEALQGAQLQSTQGALGAAQMQLQKQQADALAQQQKMDAMAANLKDARDTIAKIAAVKDDARGMVITLQGEVLFKTGKSDLKGGAMAKLDEIASALKDKDQPITVFGYTDNVGTPENNQDLSQRRADSVRTYLVSKGISQDLIDARGKGADAPVADNQSVEGRAQNRRVELVVQPKR